MFRTRNTAIEHIERYPNGTIKCKYYTIDGKREGEYLVYYENGKLCSKSNYKKGKRIYECLPYFDNSTTWSN